MKTIFDKIYILHWLPNKDRDIALKKKFKYLGLEYEYVYALPLLDIFGENNDKYQHLYITNNDNTWKYGDKIIQHWSVAFGHYMCVYQAYQLGYNNVLILENDVVINNNKKLIEQYLNNVPKDSDIIRYGYMEWDWYNTERFDNTNELFYKDNENNDFRYYGNQCYGLMNRKTMKIYLDSCNYCFNGNEDVENIHRGNKFNLNIYYATKPIFLDHIAYHEYYLNNNTNQAYILPYSINLINKYEFIE